MVGVGFEAAGQVLLGLASPKQGRGFSLILYKIAISIKLELQEKTIVREIS